MGRTCGCVPTGCPANLSYRLDGHLKTSFCVYFINLVLSPIFYSRLQRH